MGLTKRYYENLMERGFGLTGDQAVCLGCVEDDGLRSRLI